MWAAHGQAGYGLGSARDLNTNEAKAVASIIGLEQAHVMKTGTGQDSVKNAIKAGIEDVREALTKWISGDTQEE